jgi:release factor glutamine methyltransferase
LQYIFGVAHFRFLRLKAGPGCLVPRPETELLADFVLQMAPKGGMVCELGAGSGALGLSIASERPDLGVKASELSPEAFKWADLNRRELSLPNYELFSGDLFSPFAGLRFDVVAANLPTSPAPRMRPSGRA